MTPREQQSQVPALSWDGAPSCIMPDDGLLPSAGYDSGWEGGR